MGAVAYPLEGSPARPLGFVSGPFEQGAVNARLGEIVLVSPVAAMTVYLPPAQRAMVGCAVTVKNASAAATTVTVTAAGGDTIDGSGTNAIAAAWAARTYVVTAARQWSVV